MRVRKVCVTAFAWLLGAGLALAQERSAPAPEVDQALRDRAAQFLQFTMDRAYRKAYDLVAEDTKDWYLSSGKPRYTKFKIEDVVYSADLQQATVKTRVTEMFAMNGHDVPAEVVVSDIWKMVDGKWMWYHDPDVINTVFGDIKMDRSKAAEAAASPSLPKDLSPEATEAAAKKIQVPTSVSKKELVFDRTKAADEEIVFHNGLAGVIQLNVDIVGDYDSFHVQPASASVPPDGDFTFKVSFKPIGNPAASTLRFSIAPFNRALRVALGFAQ
jgi:hypothetical protein